MKTLEIRPDLVVEYSPLTTRESMQADMIIGNMLGDSPSAGALALLTSKVYSLCAVKKVNSAIATPLAGGAAFDALCAKFSLTELMKLMQSYSDVDTVSGEELKNDLGAVGPTP
jgi:hypothetical protein